jgi:hypothetical protein
MKMISIEDLKRRIKEKFCNSCSTPYKDTDILELGEYCCDMVSDTMAFVDELPTIETEPVNGWISVKDRLPEIGEHYRSKLVMCYSPDGEHEYLFDYYEMNGFGQGCFTVEKYFGITITHWRTLPKPPKGE